MLASRLFGVRALVMLIVSFALMAVFNIARADTVAPAAQLNVGDLIDGVAYFVTGAAALAAVLPIPQKAQGLFALLRRFVDLAAMNFGNAKNQKR
ncbi:MAG TPA: hypothetical protein VIZ65_01110 [Cellvibrionaceae bacterium]